MSNESILNNLNFESALNLLKKGRKMTRNGWNGKGMYVVYQAGYPNGIPINANTANATGLTEGTICKFRPYLMLKAVDGSFGPWVPSQTDLLSEDWSSVLGEENEF